MHMVSFGVEAPHVLFRQSNVKGKYRKAYCQCPVPYLCRHMHDLLHYIMAHHLLSVKRWVVRGKGGQARTRKASQTVLVSIQGHRPIIRSGLG